MSAGGAIPYASWSVLSADFLIVLHLTIGGVTLSALLHLASAKWRYRVRDLAGSLFALWPLAAVLLAVLLLVRHETFPWMGVEGHGGHELNAWHNWLFLDAREILGFAFVVWLYRRFLALQKVSERSEQDWERFKATANFIPVTHVLYGTMVAWDFEMTLLPFWESSVYGLYHFVSNFGMFLATLVALGYVLNRRGLLRTPWPDHIYNYIAQMMLAFTILWTYLFFAQYLTIWYGNLPHERDRIEAISTGDYAPLWWAFLALKFIVPFCFLVFTYFRHSPSSIFRIALCIVAGTWLERYTWVAGTVDTGPFGRPHMPFTSPFDVIVTAVTVGAGALLVRRALARNEVTLAAGAHARPAVAG